MKKFPYLEVSGSHRDIGLAIGEKFKELIQKEVEENRSKIPDYPDLLDEVDKYIVFAKKFSPKIFEELSAIAEVSGIPLREYFLLNNREVYDKSEEEDIKYAVDHCTIAVSFGSNGAIIGHNEDWTIDVLENMYILKAKVDGTTFLGLQYGGVLPGLSATINSWGLVQCINELHQYPQIGVPKNFLARAVLGCKTLDESVSLLRNAKHASGYNHVLVQGREVRNVEIAGGQVAVEKVTNNPYVHTNHYLTPELKALEKYHSKSSVARYERARELVKNNMTKEEMEALLSDTQNKEFPICRLEETVGSLVFLPDKKEVYICYGPPCRGEFVRYSI